MTSDNMIKYIKGEDYTEASVELWAVVDKNKGHVKCYRVIVDTKCCRVTYGCKTIEEAEEHYLRHCKVYSN